MSGCFCLLLVLLTKVQDLGCGVPQGTIFGPVLLKNFTSPVNVYLLFFYLISSFYILYIYSAVCFYLHVVVSELLFVSSGGKKLKTET